MDFLAKVVAGLDVAAQEVFDHAVSNVLRQGKKSANVDAKGQPGECLYRGPEGLRCGVGWCIPDGLYSGRMDQDETGNGTDVDSLIDRSLLPKSLIPHRGLLSAIQSDHDNAANENFAESFKYDARTTAADYGLVWNHD